MHLQITAAATRPRIARAPVRWRGAAFAAWLFFLTAWLAPFAARADAPVIVAGREAEIVALVKPYGDEKELAPGWKLGDIKVEPTSIRFSANGPGGKSAAIKLVHPGRAPAGADKTASFAITREGGDDPGGASAVTALIEAVRANDKGGFWPEKGPEPGRPDNGKRTHSKGSRFASGDVGRLAEMIYLVPAPLRDGVVLFCLALTLTLLHLRRVLRDEPRWMVGALVGLVVVGAALRVAISPEAPMNAWPYERVVPLARQSFDGVVLPWIGRALSARIYLTDVIFKTSLLLAIVTPLAFFAHARYVLRDARGALFAAALLVVLPNHIHFSRADSEFIQSLATSSLTFVVLYTALRSDSRAWRGVSFALLPIFSVATYFVRPENMFFYLVDIGAVWLTSGEEAPRSRKIVVIAEVTVSAAFAFVAHLLAQYQQSLEQGLSLHTLYSAVAIFFDLHMNTLINARMTPPGLTALAVLGGVVLYRSGQRARAIFLASWLLGFFVVHSFVRPSQEMMQARYHMHLITPLLLLAASAFPDMVKWPRRAAIAAAVYLAASPLVHLGFERDTNFNEMHEFAFLRKVSREIPDGCTVIEFSPAVSLSDPTHVFASRLERMAVRLEDGWRKEAFKVVNAGVLPDKGGADAHEQLSAEVRELVKNRPACLMVYEGLSCRSHRPEATTEAPVCVDLRRVLDLESVARATMRSRVYDDVNAGRLIVEPNGATRGAVVLREGEEIPLTLYRARSTPKERGETPPGAR